MCETSRGTAGVEILIENERVRVARWSFAGKGDNTGWHRHAHDFVFLPDADGALEIALPGGARKLVELKRGVPGFNPIGVEHDVINANDFAFSFVEIELLDRKG